MRTCEAPPHPHASAASSNVEEALPSGGGGQTQRRRPASRRQRRRERRRGGRPQARRLAVQRAPRRASACSRATQCTPAATSCTHSRRIGQRGSCTRTWLQRWSCSPSGASTRGGRPTQWVSRSRRAWPPPPRSERKKWARLSVQGTGRVFTAPGPLCGALWATYYILRPQLRLNRRAGLQSTLICEACPWIK